MDLAAGTLAAVVALAVSVYAALRWVRVRGGRLEVLDARRLAAAAPVSVAAGAAAGALIEAAAWPLGLAFEPARALLAGAAASTVTVGVYMPALALADVPAALEESVARARRG